MATEGRRYASALALVVLAHGISAMPSAVLGAEPSPNPASKSAKGADAEFGILQGRWVRPDGGYVIAINAADAAGRLDASYANPAPLPFAVAQATRSDGVLNVFFELRAGGYNGSTYTLTYDPARDVLKGVYYQAVARQKFDVYFARAR